MAQQTTPHASIPTPSRLSDEGLHLLKALKSDPSQGRKYLTRFQMEHRPHLDAPESTYDCCTRGFMPDHPVINHHRL